MPDGTVHPDPPADKADPERDATAQITRLCPTKAKRGRPPDPKLVALDLQLIEITQKFGPIGIRGCFYKCLSLGLFEKTEANVKRVERRLLKLRREGRVSYDAISDPASDPTWYRTYNGPEEFADDVADLYRRSLWQYADERVVIVVEKVGLQGVLAPITERWDVPLFACGGQQSETLIYRIGSLIAAWDVATYVYVLSDLDAGGDSIFETFRNGSKDAPGGISRFTKGVPIEVIKLGLTERQIDLWGLPTRPAKRSDRRSPKFIAKHGDRCVELDALGPDRLRGMVDYAISGHVSPHTVEELKITEQEERDTMRDALKALRGGGDA